MDIICNQLSDLPLIAEKILSFSEKAKVFALTGELGSGKTTLISHLCRVLQVMDVVTSPTFPIINEYRTKSGEKVYHFDFYRIKSEIELFDIGYEEYFYSGNYCFIEWPEKAGKLLPRTYVQMAVNRVKNKYVDASQANFENERRLISITLISPPEADPSFGG